MPSPSARLTQPWGPPETGKGTGLALHCPAPRAESPTLGSEPRLLDGVLDTEGRGAGRLPPGFHALPAPSPRSPPPPTPPDCPQTSRTAPDTLGTGVRARSARGDPTLRWHLRDDREAAGVPGERVCVFSASQMNPPKSLPKPAASRSKTSNNITIPFKRPKREAAPATFKGRALESKRIFSDGSLLREASYSTALRTKPGEINVRH